MRLKRLLTFFIFSLSSASLWCQHFSKRKQYASIEFGISQAYFRGQDISFKENSMYQPGFSFAIKQKKTPRLRTGLSISMHQMRSSEVVSTLDPYCASLNNCAYTQEELDLFTNLIQQTDPTFINPAILSPKVTYRTKIFSYGGFLTLDLFQNRSRWTKRPDYNFYLFLGAKWSHMRRRVNIKGQESVRLSSLNNVPLDWEFFVIPVGLGFRYKLDKRWDISFEALFNQTFTPHLDLLFDQNAISYNPANDSYITFNVKFNKI